MRQARRTNAQELLAGADASLLDVVDHVLNKGVVLTGDVVLGVAGVDLIYLRLSALLCSVDALERTASRSGTATR
jgi:Gas vesicle protein